jgi:hypothetical protein
MKKMQIKKKKNLLQQFRTPSPPHSLTCNKGEGNNIKETQNTKLNVGKTTKEMQNMRTM